MIQKHKHLMRVRGTFTFDGRSWTRMECDHKNCDEERYVEHGWFSQQNRTWKKV